MRTLCRLTDIPDGAARGFGPARGGFVGLLAVRQGETMRVYVNACPHIGVPLDAEPGRFLDARGARIICGTHGAAFRVEDGACVHGPCLGERLEAVPATLGPGGAVLVPETAGL